MPASWRPASPVGANGARPDDGLELRDCRIGNAVRCVPPRNRPRTAEIGACNPFLGAEIRAMARLRAILALGRVAHGAVLAALGLKPSAAAFAHGGLPRRRARLALIDSYHCSASTPIRDA